MQRLSLRPGVRSSHHFFIPSPISNYLLPSTNAQSTATDKDEVPTHRAITERLVKIRAMAKANGAGHFVVSKGSAKDEAKGGANPHTPKSTPRKPRVKKDPATPGTNGTSAKRGRGRPAAAATVKQEAITSDEEGEEEVNTSPTKITADCNVLIRKRVTSSAEKDTNTMTTPTQKAGGTSNPEEKDSDTMTSPSKKAKTNGTAKGKGMPAKALTPVRAEEDSDTMASPSKKAKTNGTPKGKTAFTKALTPVRAATPDEEELDGDTIRVASDWAFSFDGAADTKVEDSGSEYEEGY